MKKFRVAVAIAVFALPGAAMAQFTTTTGSTSSSATGSSVAGGGVVTLESILSGNASINLGGSSLGTTRTLSRQTTSNGTSSTTTASGSPAPRARTGTTSVAPQRSFTDFVSAIFTQAFGL